MKKVFINALPALVIFGIMLCAFALGANVADSRDAGYLGLRLLDDRHPARSTSAGDRAMVVLVPEVGEASALPPLPLTQGYRSMVHDHPHASSRATGPLAAFFFHGLLDPGRCALLKSTGGWNYGIVGGAENE